ncbi:MAG: tetratricopeptide repeat protein [Thermoplasmata archaeon]|nr:tetratricopeptide repeat protein [Thermoplasmata archaeon]
MGKALVNREKEMGIILEALKNAREGRGRTLIISGETGIGKTRLLEELRSRCNAANMEVYWGSGIDENAMPYHPFLTLIQKNRDVIEELRTNAPPAISLLLGEQVKPPASGEIDFTMESRRLRELIFRMIKMRAASNTIVLLFDDIQWFDPSSIALLHYLARNISDISVLICCSYNTEEIKESKTSKLLSELRQMNIERIIDTIELKPLSPEDVHNFIKTMTEKEPRKDVAKKVFEKTDGNPLFIEEIIKAYGEKIVHRSFAIDEEETEIPQTVKYIITRKMERMSPEKKKILTFASVFGREFYFSVIQKLCEMSEESVLENLEELIDEGVLFEKGYEEIFCFRHNLMREVIYSSMNTVRRKQIHAKIAAELSANKTMKNTGEIAKHYYLAGNYREAFNFAKEAGENFAKLYASEESLFYLDIAMKSLEKLNDGNLNNLLEVLKNATEISFQAGKYMDTITYLQRIEEIAQEENDKDLLLETTIKMGEAYFRIGAYEEALFRFEDAIGKVGSNEILRGKIFKGISEVYREKGKLDYAIEYAEHAIEIARKHNEMKLLGDGYMDLALGYYRKGSFEEAIENIEKSVVVRKEIKDERGLMSAVNNLGAIHLERGNYEDALRCFEEYGKFAEKTGDLWGVAIAQNNLGVLWSEKGDLKKSLRHYENSVHAYQRVGDENGIAVTKMNIGIIYHYLGEYDTAIEYYTQCLRYAESQKDMITEQMVQDNIGWVYLEKESYDEALVAFERALDLAQRIGARKEISSSKIGIAHTYSALTFYGKAIEYAEDALEIAKELKTSVDEARAYRALGVIYTEMNDFQKARQYLERSYKIARDVGNLMRIIEVHESLLDLSIKMNDRVETLRIFEALKGIYNQIGAQKKLERVNWKVQRTEARG